MDNDMNELSLFDEPEQELAENKLKCYKSELKSVDYLTLTELFKGYDTLKAITFSYDVSFIETILSNFQNSKVILGADFLVERNGTLNNILKIALATAQEAKEQLTSHEKLVKMIKDGVTEFRTPKLVDHRKIYLLKANDGRTRVIFPSANMSTSAWNGNKKEDYKYDDTEYCYDEYEKDFDDAWEKSEEIPYSILVAKKDDNLINGNPLIEKTKNMGSVTLLQQDTNNVPVEYVKYFLDHQRINDEYDKLLSGIKVNKSKNGFVEIVPKTIDKMTYNAKKAKAESTINTVREYPNLTIDYEVGKVLLDGVPYNLHPKEDDVKSDIIQIQRIFDNFKTDFICDPFKMQESHFKMMNAIFASPFYAKIRCACRIRGIEASSLPMYMLAASSGANCGKTFMIKATLKLMTDKIITPEKVTDINESKKKSLKEHLGGLQFYYKGLPIFIDEMDSKSFTNIKELIKNPERCENNLCETMPILIFAGNTVLEPDEILRKRMVFLRFEARLRSDIDQCAYKAMSDAILKRLHTGFFSEYFRRMYEKISAELEYIMTEKELPDSYYPDVIKTSSETFIEVFRDFGFAPPAYIRRMTWNDDYSINAKYIYEDALSAIKKLYEKNKSAFTLNKKTITIEIGNGTKSKRMCESWVNTLPSEMNAELIPLKDSLRITLNRNEFESRIGYKLGGFSIFKKFWK